MRDYIEKPKKPRRRAQLHSILLAQVRDVAKGGPVVVARLHEDLCEQAKTTGCSQPSYRMTQHAYLTAAGDRLKRSAGAFGRRSAVIDAGVHGTLITAATHERWCLDECTIPVHVRLWDERQNCFVSAQVDVVLIYDACSRVILSFLVVDPSRRDTESGELARSGYDVDDVLGAFLSAAMPDLAHPATAAFSGFLPQRLRMDNAPAHKAMAELFDEKKLGVRVEFVQSRRPDQNGLAERGIGTFKNFLRYKLRGVIGHSAEYKPTDEITVIPEEARTRAGATPFRERRVLPIEPADLLDVSDLVPIVAEVIRQYNERHKHRGHGISPAAAYQRYMPRASMRARNGRDALLLLETGTGLVSKGMLSYKEGGLERKFAVEAAGWSARSDTAVTYWRDPLHRGIHVKVFNDVVFCSPLMSWAERVGGCAINADRAALAKFHSENASAAARERREDSIGGEAAARADENLAGRAKANRARKARRRAQRAGIEVTDGGRPSAPKAPRTLSLVADVADSPSPQAPEVGEEEDTRPLQFGTRNFNDTVRPRAPTEPIDVRIELDPSLVRPAPAETNPPPEGGQ